VLVTANYKLSVDRLRSQLGGIDAWVLVLDTRGINVWCAAGKGTFGTQELENRMRETNLGAVVSHRKLVLPQLGAPGVAAHEIAKRTGFRVLYGPVRAQDLPAYLHAGFQATEEMRRVRFDFKDRLSQVSVELTQGLKPLLVVLAVVVLLAALAGRPFSVGRAVELALAYGLWVVAAYFAASVLTLALLPWLPGRAFSLKGFWIGLGLSLLCGLFFREFPALQASGWATAGWMVLLPALSSFIAMNFTGSTPFTSLSGVKYEMRHAVPLQVLGTAAALGLWITGVVIR
jgi:acetyl-CoA decarbonylase/synthase complex subunit gamma